MKTLSLKAAKYLKHTMHVWLVNITKHLSHGALASSFDGSPPLIRCFSCIDGLFYPDSLNINVLIKKSRYEKEIKGVSVIINNKNRSEFPSTGHVHIC